MQIQRYGYGIIGLAGSLFYGLRFLVMVGEKAPDRYRALQFWEKSLEAHGVYHRILDLSGEKGTLLTS